MEFHVNPSLFFFFHYSGLVKKYWWYRLAKMLIVKTDTLRLSSCHFTLREMKMSTLHEVFNVFFKHVHSMHKPYMYLYYSMFPFLLFEIHTRTNLKPPTDQHTLAHLTNRIIRRLVGVVDGFNTNPRSTPAGNCFVSFYLWYHWYNLW